MVDDLISRGVTEPYRMFTSRAEFRLSLRADNADQRLTPLGIALGCVGEARRHAFEAKAEALAAGRARLEALSFTPRQLAGEGARIGPDGPRRSGFEALSLPDASFAMLARLAPEFGGIPAEIGAQLARDALYANYLDRQEEDAEALRRDEAQEIPAGFDYAALPGLSHELKSKLGRLRPATLAQAGKVEGMTPAALLLILARLKAERRSA
jgi:tRNA uridine 5-carboxymethylaminomethyl modification enzyme